MIPCQHSFSLLTLPQDPAVLGGLLVTMKNTTIDLTVTSKLVDFLARKQMA